MLIYSTVAFKVPWPLEDEIGGGSESTLTGSGISTPEVRGCVK